MQMSRLPTSHQHRITSTLWARHVNIKIDTDGSMSRPVHFQQQQQRCQIFKNDAHRMVNAIWLRPLVNRCSKTLTNGWPSLPMILIGLFFFFFFYWFLIFDCFYLIFDFWFLVFFGFFFFLKFNFWCLIFDSKFLILNFWFLVAALVQSS